MYVFSDHVCVTYFYLYTHELEPLRIESTPCALPRVSYKLLKYSIVVDILILHTHGDYI